MGRAKNHQTSRRNFYKKSHNFNANSSGHNTLQLEQHGFFVTFCSSKESFVRNEIYNLLNRFADQLYGPEFPDETELETADLHDLDSALEHEKTKLNDAKKNVRRFQIVKSGTKHSFFVTTTLPTTSINKFAETIFNTVLESKEQHSRYVERLLPVAFVCKAYEDDLRKLIIRKEFIEQIFLLVDVNATSNESIWFDVQAKKSNNTTLKSSRLEEIVISDLLSRKSDDLHGKTFKRDYKKPQIHVLIHVIKGLLLVSIVRNYEIYKKYNLASLNVTATSTGEEKQLEPDQEQQQQQPSKITFEGDDDDDNSDGDDDDNDDNNEKETNK